MDTRPAKSCGMGVSICFFLYIRICHGVIRLFCRRKALPKLQKCCWRCWQMWYTIH